MGAMTGNTNPCGTEGDKSNVTDREQKGSRKVGVGVEGVAWGGKYIRRSNGVGLL